MILHKIFHLNQTAEHAQAQLTNVDGYRQALFGVDRVEFTGHGVSHWTMRLAPFLNVNLVMTDTETTTPGTVVFRSMDGNAEVFGMITFHSVRPRLTEVDVMLDYQFRSPVLRLVDRVFGLGNRFLTRHLRAARAHFENLRSPARVREVSAGVPVFALKAAA